MDDVVFTDLSQLDVMSPSDEGYWLELLNPVTKKPISFEDESGKVVTMAFKLAGPQSERMQRYLAEQLNRTMKEGRKGQLDGSAEAVDAREIALYAHATLDWRIPRVDGAWLSFTPASVRKLLADLRFSWVRVQVAQGVGDSDPFMKRLQASWSASPSEPSS